VASIAPDDALILPHRANPRWIGFLGTTGPEGLAGNADRIAIQHLGLAGLDGSRTHGLALQGAAEIGSSARISPKFRKLF
jgi:hypothetical protein